MAHKENERENEERKKLCGVTLDNGGNRHDPDDLNEKDGRYRAIHPVRTTRTQQKCHTNHRAEENP